MIAVFAALELLLLLPMSWLVGCSTSSRTARHRASYTMAFAGLIALGQIVWHTFELPWFGWSTVWLSADDPHSWVPAFSLISCLMGFTAIALSPVSETRPGTFRRILLLIAIALLFLAIRHPIALAVLWGASALVAWLELRDVKSAKPASGIAKLFAIYHFPSAFAFGLGAVLLVENHTAAGVMLVLIGIGIREAVIPLHSWFPPFVQYAPMGLVVAFFAPQLGVYAHLELLRGELPNQLAHGVASLGAITAVVAAMLGIAQTDARRALAFLAMSQTGLVAFGLDTSSSVAQIGALLTWQVIGVATAGFAMTLTSLQARRGDLSLQTPAGSFTQTPRMAVAFLFMGFASVGLPLTLGFIAEDLLVQGSVREFPALAFALIIATALNGVSVMRAFFVLFSGSAQHIGERDLMRREAGTLTVVMATLLIGGLFPGATVRGLERVTDHEEEALVEDSTPTTPASSNSQDEDAADLACQFVQAPVNIWTTTGPTGRHRVAPYFDLERAIHGREIGTAVRAKWALGSPIMFHGRRYQFEQVHFHGPSTHMLDGMRYPMEMHVVNVASVKSVNDPPQYLIISVLFRNGRKNQDIDRVLNGTFKRHRTVFDPDRKHVEEYFSSEERRKYYQYRGSLAVPPYDEAVDLFVLSEPRTASPEQIAKARAPSDESGVSSWVPQGVELVE